MLSTKVTGFILIIRNKIVSMFIHFYNLQKGNGGLLRQIFTWGMEKRCLFMQTIIKLIGGQQEVNYVLITQ